LQVLAVTHSIATPLDTIQKCMETYTAADARHVNFPPNLGKGWCPIGRTLMVSDGASVSSYRSCIHSL